MMRKTLTYALIFFQIALIVSLIRGIQLAVKARSRVTDLEVQKEKLVSEHKELAERLEYVNSEYYAEKAAREELQLGKPGETVVIVPEDQRLIEQPKKEEQEDPEKPNWEKWWDVVRGKGQ